MTIIFFGSDPRFSPPVLEALAEAGHEILLIVTKGDVFGKGQGLKAKGQGKTKIIQAKNSEDITKEKLMLSLNPSHPDVIILAAFGPPFLPNEILDWPTYGCLNVHASLLPRWRGASPVFAAIAAGDNETGVSIMKMTEDVDRGPILGQRKIKIRQPLLRTVLGVRQGLSSQYDTRESLTKCLGILGGKLIVETLQKLENDHIKFISQSKKSPTPYTRRLTKEDGRIDWNKSPQEIERFIRAVTPWPGAWTEYRDEGQRLKAEGKPIKILEALLVRSSLSPYPLSLSPSFVQLPGKNPISWNAFLAGHPNTKLG